MERSPEPVSSPAAPTVAKQTGCPMCGTELERQSGIGICDGCNWVQQHPAD